MKPQNQPVASVCVSILILIKIFSFSFVKGSDFVEPSSTIKQTENPDYIFPFTGLLSAPGFRVNGIG